MPNEESEITDNNLVILTSNWYNISMKNWSVDTNYLKKFPQKFKVWQLEQLINFGLDGKRILRKDLEENIGTLNIDPDKKTYLKFLLKNI